eukprot:SAG11_NODE_9193_length_934_cov_1.040719_1_plen_82_part_01
MAVADKVEGGLSPVGSMQVESAARRGPRKCSSFLNSLRPTQPFPSESAALYALPVRSPTAIDQPPREGAARRRRSGAPHQRG